MITVKNKKLANTIVGLGLSLISSYAVARSVAPNYCVDFFNQIGTNSANLTIDSYLVSDNTYQWEFGWAPNPPNYQYPKFYADFSWGAVVAPNQDMTFSVNAQNGYIWGGAGLFKGQGCSGLNHDQFTFKGTVLNQNVTMTGKLDLEDDGLVHLDLASANPMKDKAWVHVLFTQFSN